MYPETRSESALRVVEDEGHEGRAEAARIARSRPGFAARARGGPRGSREPAGGTPGRVLQTCGQQVRGAGRAAQVTRHARSRRERRGRKALRPPPPSRGGRLPGAQPGDERGVSRALAVCDLARPGALSFPGRPARASARGRPQRRSSVAAASRHRPLSPRSGPLESPWKNRASTSFGSARTARRSIAQAERVRWPGASVRAV